MTDDASNAPSPLSTMQRSGILLVAFLGWFFGGVQIGITGVAMRDAPIELMDRVGSLDLATYNQLQTTHHAELSSQQSDQLTSIVGSLFAGLIACTVGRRLTYALTSIGALLVAQYAFWFTTPTDDSFLIWVAILGFFNGVYFGWLPFFLPEMFETRVRSTGTGISFNTGRILTAITIFATGAMKDLFDGNYAMIGRVTSWVFLLGVVAIVFAPDTSRKEMDK